MRLVVGPLVLLLALPLFGADAPEAAKVAAWVRALPPAEPDASFFGVLGGVSTTHIGPVSDFVRTSGPKALYASATELGTAESMLLTRANYLASLGAGGIRWFRDVQNLPWGMVEVERDSYRWDLIDTIVQTVANAGGRYVGTVMPYAGWELRAAGYPAATDEMCRRLRAGGTNDPAVDQESVARRDLVLLDHRLREVVVRIARRNVVEIRGERLAVTLELRIDRERGRAVVARCCSDVADDDDVVVAGRVLDEGQLVHAERAGRVVSECAERAVGVTAMDVEIEDRARRFGCRLSVVGCPGSSASGGRYGSDN